MHAHDNPVTLAVVALINDNEKLSRGVAEQAKIIRELRDEVSRLQASLDIQTYNVEFLKQQGRRTRLKLRSAKRGQKEAIKQVTAAAEQVEVAEDRARYMFQSIGKLRVDNRRLDRIVTNKNLEIATLKASAVRSTSAPLTWVTPLPRTEPGPVSDCNCSMCRDMSRDF